MASTGYSAEHYYDENGMPAGGITSGKGFRIEWQNGPLVDPETGERREQSGAFVEDVIAAAKDRIEYYQEGQFACYDNAVAIEHLAIALGALKARTRDREARGVEGTHQV